MYITLFSYTNLYISKRMRSLEVIRSKDNKILKHSRKLGIKKYRQESRQFIIEGVRFIEEALNSNARIKYCLCSENLERDRIKSLVKSLSERNVEIYHVQGELLDEICDTNTPQGIAAVVEKDEFPPEEILKSTDFLIVLDRIQDPGNLGTIIRTADAAGAGGVVLSEGTVDPYSPKVLRSTMGSIFHVPVIQFQSTLDSVNRLKEEGFIIYASCLEGSVAYYNEDYQGKTALVIGNEANGIDMSIISTAEKRVLIPMPGRAESLNASVAAGILMFEVARCRAHIDK